MCLWGKRLSAKERPTLHQTYLHEQQYRVDFSFMIVEAKTEKPKNVEQLADQHGVPCPHQTIGHGRANEIKVNTFSFFIDMLFAR